MKEVWIDRFLKQIILPKGSDRDEKITLDIDGHLKGRRFPNISRNYYEIFGIIDGKASTLLTHISMMIAANAVLLSVNSSTWLDMASLLLLFCFILVALLTLRLLRFWAEGFTEVDAAAVAVELSGEQGENVKAMVATYNREVCYRDRLYKLCLNLTTVFTLLSLVPVVGFIVEQATS